MKLKTLLAGLVIAASSSAMASEHAHWGYTGHMGPEHWGELSSDFSTCKTGKTQSPINLTEINEANLPAIQFNYQSSGLNILNNGHTVQANFAPGSSMTVEGIKFDLLQVHFHTPSENNLQGFSYPMEAHFVHKSADGQLAVVAVLIREGAADSFIQKIVDSMPVHPEAAHAVKGVSLSAMDYLPADKAYYRFDGSLTTPPCTEGVRWFVMKNAAYASKEQIAALHSVLGNNNRPLQARNGRMIKD
ncbi:carbonic anhydrase [Thiomicrorhabdus sp.]|uniref:carbonic anhydrase n=1 Tax=Thiomicrorhabdus sp. TaxID=2039724 RepID=UPI0035627539